MRLFSRKRVPREDAPAMARSAVERYAYPGAVDGFPRPLGLSVYDEMQADPLVRSALMVKKLGALAVPWRVAPANDSADALEKVRFIEYAFAEMRGSVVGVLFDAMDAIAKGYSVLEKVLKIDDSEYAGKTIIASIKPKDPSLFGFDVDEFLNIKGLTLTIPGEPQRSLPISKFIVYAHNSRYGQPMGESDLRAAHRHWAIKRELIRQWTAHLEKFASPTVTGKFKRGTPEDAQAALLDALDNVRRQAAVVYPDDVEVALLDAGREARSSYLDAIDYHNREMARAILGQTLTTEDSQRVGSLALGKVHLQVLIMQLAGLRRDLAECVMNEQIIRPLVALNFSFGNWPVFQFDEPELDVFRTGRVV
jgi:phage gp29-like protein